MKRIVALAAAGALLVGGCGILSSGPGSTPTPTPSGQPSASSGPQESSAPTPALAKFYGQKLAWHACNDSDRDYECARLTVPLDYAKPEGKTIWLAVLRVPASGDGRLGSLVVNPGGPGGSGVKLAAAARNFISPEVRDAYSIVGFDPRGVGSSAPVECLTDAQTDEFVAAPATPDTPAERSEYAKDSADLGKACEQKSAELLPVVNTLSAAKDMDVLRAALGDSHLDYLGFSYGTFLGVVYAEQFPTKVGRFVLDGAVDPSLTNAEISRQQAVSFDRELNRYLAYCVSQGDCPLGDSVQAAQERLKAFVTGLDANPLVVDGGREVNTSVALTAIIGSMYSPEQNWSKLTTALGEGLQGDGKALMAIVDDFNERGADGKYENNGIDAIYAVSCTDRTDRQDSAETAKLAAQWSNEAPFFGAMAAYGNLPCATWPAPATFSPHRIVAPGTPEILVIGTEYDPATPLQWSQAMADQLANGVFLEWQGADGHTAYGRGSECIAAQVDRFLLTGQAPADGTVCPREGADPVTTAKPAA